MSRIISAAAIAVFIAAVCTASILHSSYFAKKMTDSVNNIYFGNENESDELEEKWSEFSDIAAAYFNHEELERVTVLVSSLEEIGEMSDPMFRMNCREIELIMEHLRESQLPKLNNIF